MLTPEEIKAQLDRIGQEVKEQGTAAKQEVTEALKDKAKTADVEAIKEAFESYCEKAEQRMDELKSIAEAQGMKLNEYSEAGKSSTKTFGENLFDAIKAQADTMAAMKDNKFAKGLDFTAKAAGTMGTANVLPSVANSIPYSLVDFESGITRIARRRPFLRQILNARRVSSMYVAWAEQVNVDGDAATVAEGAAKPQIDFDVQEATRKVEKIAAYAKTSKENLADVQGMYNFITDEIRERVELKLDAQLYSGNGTSPNLKGLTSWATTASVAGTGLALGVDAANNYDVLLAVAAVMENNNFSANVALVNPLDLALMSVSKTSQGIYIMPPFATENGQEIAGLRIIANSGVTAGDFVVMDTTKVNLGMREEFNIQVGFENDDFTKNLVTILGELRAVLYVKTNYANAVIKGTFATVKAAMETA